ncbi:MAG: guanitoxin biosynthesis MBL fold metallo-hydrolase GntH [Pseudomonadales bacterium]
MLKPKLKFLGIVAVLLGAVASVYLLGLHNEQTGQEFSIIGTAQAAGGKVTDPKGTAPDRYAYYPGTEALAEDEIRVIACGTGMPSARISQASTCFLMELGNGDKFIFDLGSGSMRNINSLMIPSEYLTKVFLSHLHTDHWGDLSNLWAGGWTAGRPVPLEVWGPSGMTPEMGTKYAVEHFMKTFNWDYATRAFMISPTPGQIIAHEFDYKAVNEIVYQENGVTIRSWPAIHAGDGPVSFSLEYAGLKIIFGGDTYPNTWFIKYAKNADLVIHEAFMTPQMFVSLYNQPPSLAWRACCAFHTSPQAFGKVMSEVTPRQAVAYHFFNEEATRYGIYEGIRETYDGPVSMAADLMVWNITKDKVTERMAVVPQNGWEVPGAAVQPPREQGRPPVYSKYILQGRWDQGVQPVQKKMLDEFMEKHNLQNQDWRKQMKK